MPENTYKKYNLSLVENPIPDALIRMTMPMIFGMAMLFAFGLVDTLFISFLGTGPLTAISFTFPVTFTIISLAIGLGIGTSAVVARCLGRGDYATAKEASTVTNYVAVLLSVILSLLTFIFMDRIFLLMGASEQMLTPIREYMVYWLPGSNLMVAMMTGNSILRACGDTRTPSIIMAGSGLLNIVLDPILIFGFGPIPAMGIGGAAIATVISWLLGFLCLFYLLAFRLNLINKTLPRWPVMYRSGREMLRIGLPAAGANMMTPIAAGIMTAIAAGFGESVVAAFGVGSRIEPFATLIVLAMSTTLPPLISQNFGARRLDRVVEAYRISTRFIMLWQMFVYLILVA
ncbi:MAG: MATE family efflux transporter, partial [Pseudohongiellaceae bacterium]